MNHRCLLQGEWLFLNVLNFIILYFIIYLYFIYFLIFLLIYLYFIFLVLFIFYPSIILLSDPFSCTSQVAQWERICLPMQEMKEMWVWSLGQEDPLEKEMATHSSILAWEVPWTEELCGLQSRGFRSVQHDWVYKHTHTHTHTHIFLEKVALKVF